MTAQTVPHRVRNAKAFVAHLLVATESEAERDLSPIQGAADALGHKGSVPVVRKDLPLEIGEALALKAGRVLTTKQFENLASGLRADGREQPRAARAAKTGRVQIATVTNSVHISVSIARNNCKTPEAARMFDEATRGANADAMRHWQDNIGGFTRRGRGGRLGDEKGDVAWVTTHHRTARPTKEGYVAPQEHFENAVPNLVSTPSGHFGAMNLRRMKGRVVDNRIAFHQSLGRRLEAMGANVEMRDGYCTLKAVPQPLCDAMAARSADAEKNGRAYAASNGLDWDKLPKHAQARFTKMGARITQGARVDGMADRPAWRTRAAQMGFPAQDLVRVPPGAGPLARRAAAIRDRAQALQAEARKAGQPLSSLVAVKARKRLALAVQAATAHVQGTIRLAAPPPTTAQRDALRQRTAALRAATGRIVTMAAQGEAKRLGREFKVEIERYKLRQVARAVSCGAQMIAVAAARDGPLAKAARVLAHRAEDTIRAARSQQGSFRQNLAKLHFGRVVAAAAAARKAGQGVTLPLASMRSQVAAAAQPPPQTKLAARSAQIAHLAAQAKAATASAAPVTPAVPVKPAGARPPQLPIAARARAVAAHARQMRAAAQPPPKKAAAPKRKPSAVVAAATKAKEHNAAKRLSVGVKRTAAKAAPAPVAAPAAAAPQQSKPDALDAQLKVHGSPENLMRARIRIETSRFASGQVDLGDATTRVFQTWAKLQERGMAPKDMLPSRIMQVVENRILEGADKLLPPGARYEEAGGSKPAPTFKEIPTEQAKVVSGPALPPLRKVDLSEGQGLGA